MLGYNFEGIMSQQKFMDLRSKIVNELWLDQEILLSLRELINQNQDTADYVVMDLLDQLNVGNKQSIIKAIGVIAKFVPDKIDIIVDRAIQSDVICFIKDLVAPNLYLFDIVLERLSEFPIVEEKESGYRIDSDLLRGLVGLAELGHEQAIIIIELVHECSKQLAIRGYLNEDSLNHLTCAISSIIQQIPSCSEVIMAFVEDISVYDSFLPYIPDITKYLLDANPDQKEKISSLLSSIEPRLRESLSEINAKIAALEVCDEIPLSGDVFDA
ncbi:MAG: hypothetical protein RLZZ59_525 [Pseudomonadota bacterium]|jgi:hypothetical protein